MKAGVEAGNSGRLSFKQSLVIILTMPVLILTSVLIWKTPIQLAIFFEIIITIFLSLYWGYDWESIEEMLFVNFKSTGRVILILLLIGMLIGIWISNGTVPSMVYYGLKLTDPGYFLVLSFIITSLVSMALGTGVGTASTIGLALISIAQGLGLSLPLVAGAVISGSYLGDRTSPISSIAIITAHSSGVKLNELVRHMLYTLLPAYIISAVSYLIIGLFLSPRELQNVSVQLITEGLEQIAFINGWLFLLPLLVIVLAFLGVPTVINLIINLLVSLGGGLLVSGRSWRELLNSMYYGVDSRTGIDILDNLLNRGGLLSMLEIVSLIILAVMLGGLFNELGILRNVLNRLITGVKNKGQLVFITETASILTAVLSCNQLLSLYLPGKMLADKYDELGVDRKDLGRALSDSGVVISPLIPWNINGIMMTGILGISTMEYLPYSFLLFLLPLSGLLFGFFSIHKG